MSNSIQQQQTNDYQSCKNKLQFSRPKHRCSALEEVYLQRLKHPAL